MIATDTYDVAKQDNLTVTECCDSVVSEFTARHTHKICACWN